MDYNTWLRNAIVTAMENLGFERGAFDFHVFDERDFEKSEGDHKMTGNYIPIIVRRLPSTLSYNVENTPVLIYFLSESDDNVSILSILSQFAKENNFYSTTESGNLTTLKFSTPSVLSNFEYAGIGFRSAYYINANIQIVKNVVSLDYLGFSTDNITYADLTSSIVSFSLSYKATLDTAMIGEDELANSIEKSAVQVLSFTLPASKTNLIQEIMGQMMGKRSGDQKYYFKMTIFGFTTAFAYRTSQSVYGSVAGEAPSIAFSFAK